MKKLLLLLLALTLFAPAAAHAQAFNSYTNVTALNADDEFAIYCPTCTLSVGTKMRNWIPSQLLRDSTTLASPSADRILFYDFSAGKWTSLTVGSGLDITGTTLSATSGSGTVTSVAVSGGTTGLSVSGSPITTSGTITLSGVVIGANGGTGVANTGKTITLGGNLTTSGPYATTIASTGDTSVVLPVTGTLSTLAGAETLTNKTINASNNTLTNIPLTTSVTGILPAANGGTANGFTAFSGPTTSTKTFTLPNASATILTSDAAVTVAQGGTGAATLTGIVKGNGTSAFTAATAGTDYVAPATVTAYTAQQNFAQATLAYASPIAWNLNVGQVSVVTMTGNTTLQNPSNKISGGTYILRFVQDATGGRTITFGSDYKFPAGIAPQLSGNPNAVDILSCVSDASVMNCILQKDFR